MSLTFKRDAVENDAAAMSEACMARSYHHGDLRGALVEAALTLLEGRPVEAVAVNDAARALGVSTAAPYRHFADRDELLSHVAARGFDMLSAEMEVRMVEHPQGSIARIVAGGFAYIAFGAAHPNLFHLMWGATRLTTGREVAEASGSRCYETFISNLSETMAAEGFGSQAPSEFGAPLWTMVHGYASLMIGGAKHLSHDISAVEHLVETATRAYFAGLKTMGSSGEGLPIDEPVEPASVADAPPKGRLLDPNRDGCAAFNLRRASRAVTRRFEQIMRPVDLTAFQFTALVVLSERDGLTQSRMADLFDMSLSTLNRNIAPITRRGLVSIEADAEDARRRCVFLTPEGRAILDEALPLWREAQGWALGRVGADTWQEVRHALKHLSA